MKRAGRPLREPSPSGGPSEAQLHGRGAGGGQAGRGAEELAPGQRSGQRGLGPGMGLGPPWEAECRQELRSQRPPSGPWPAVCGDSLEHTDQSAGVLACLLSVEMEAGGVHQGEIQERPRGSAPGEARPGCSPQATRLQGRLSAPPGRTAVPGATLPFSTETWPLGRATTGRHAPAAWLSPGPRMT